MGETEQQWFYASLGKKIGPLRVNDLIAELASRPDGREVLVWRHGLADWAKAGSLPELTLSPPPIPVANPMPGKSTPAWKVIAWVIAAPVVLFIGFAILLEASDSLSDTETFARSAGMSVSQCRDVRMTFGERYDVADAACLRRQPKKK